MSPGTCRKSDRHFHRCGGDTRPPSRVRTVQRFQRQMQFTPLTIPQVMRIDLEPISDSRGFFARLMCCEKFRSQGINSHIQQCNNTLTRTKGSIRGLHFQRPPRAESKIIRCVRGAVLDVAVDLRQNSETFGQFCTCELTDDNRSMLAIPPGFAHGFQTLTDDAELIYFHSESYSPEHEGGVNPLDPAISIPWPLPVAEVSERDTDLPGINKVAPIKL
ncbi:MAG: dTDP-4-dehydrorhamnose 3,5-epimerase [Planctomycetaceae bacterium]